MSISQRGADEEIIFPWRERTYLTGRCSSSNSLGDRTSNTVPLPVSFSTPPLPVTVIRDLPTTLSEEARNALNFCFKKWYPNRARPRSAQVLLVLVRQPSTFPRGIIISSQQCLEAFSSPPRICTAVSKTYVAYWSGPNTAGKPPPSRLWELSVIR